MRLFSVQRGNLDRLYNVANLFTVFLMIYVQLHAQNSVKKQFVVSGVVLNAADSNGVRSAFVVLQGKAGPNGTGSSDAVGTLTDAAGRFSIHHAEAGEFQMLVEKRGYLSYSQPVTLGINDGQQGESSGNDKQLQVRLLPQGVIAGRVLDPNQEPFVGAIIQVSKLYVEGRRSTLVPIAQAFADDQGNYRVAALSPGRYYISAFYQDQGSRLGLRLRKVNEPSGSGSVPETEDYAVTYYPGVTDPQTARAVSVNAGATRDGIDIPVLFERSYKVEGILTGLPPDAPKPRIFLQPEQPGQLGPSRFVSPTGESNQFSFNSIPPGVYVLRTQSSGAGLSLGGRQRLVVGAGDVSGVTLSLTAPFSVSGRAILEGGGALPSSVSLRIHGIDRRFSGVLHLDQDGSFTHALPGSDGYEFDVTSTEGRYYVKNVTVNGQDISRGGVPLSDPSQVVSIVVSDKAATLRGLAQDSMQRPASKGAAVLASTDLAEPRAYVAPVGSDGTFKVIGLVPGRYRLKCFSDLDIQGGMSADVQRATRESGADLTFAGGEVKNLTTITSLAGSI